MTLSGIALSLSLSLSLATFTGCSSEEARSGDGDSADAGRTHRDEMARCDKVRGSEIASAITPEDQREALSGWFDCLASANEKAVDRMEATLKDADSALAGTVMEAVANARSAAEVLCPALVDSATGIDDATGGVMIIGCNGERERALGRLLDGFAELDQEAETIAEDRATFGACYETFDKDIVDQQPGGPAFQLATCIATQIKGERVAKMVARVRANFPERDPADVERIATHVVSLSIDTDTELCGLAAEAGPDGGGSLAIANASMCSASAASLLDAHMSQFESEPDAP